MNAPAVTEASQLYHHIDRRGDLIADVGGRELDIRHHRHRLQPPQQVPARVRVRGGERDKTEADVEAVITSGGEPPGWMQDVAGVPGLSPNQSVTVTRTLGAGSYVFMCFFPDAEGTPHAALGMVELFTIVGDTGAALPMPDATITRTDDGLKVPTLTAGEQVAQFENGGSEPHELFLATFEPGMGVKDVDRWIEGGYRGEPPATFFGGMQTIPAGESVFLTIDLEPGVEYTGHDFSTRSMETFTVT